MRGHLVNMYLFSDQNIMIVKLGKRQDKKTEEIYPKINKFILRKHLIC